MKRKIFIAIALVTVVLACNKEKQTVAPQPTTVSTETTSQNHHSGERYGDTTALFITQSEANQMIGSYVASLNGDPNNTQQNPDVHAFIINADSLRAYLQNPQIKSIKLIQAHTMSYINAGNFGKFAGNQASAMTVIIAGIDIQGSYIYYGQNHYVLDHALPCPSSCPSGTAGNDLLQ